MNMYRMQLDSLGLHADPAILERVLEPLGVAISGSAELMERAEASETPDYIEAVVDDECSLIEALIGAALVAAQAHMSGVVAKTLRIHSRAKAEGHLLTTTPSTKDGVRGFGSPVVGASTYTAIQVIHEFANYFKHRDEWLGSWSKASSLNLKTIQLIAAIGAQEGSSGNLRTGIKALGIRDYRQVSLLAPMIGSWRENLIAAHSVELRALGLI